MIQVWFLLYLFLLDLDMQSPSYFSSWTCLNSFSYSSSIVSRPKIIFIAKSLKHFQPTNKSVFECYNMICTTCRSTESWFWRIIGCNCAWWLKHRDACPSSHHKEKITTDWFWKVQKTQWNMLHFVGKPPAHTAKYMCWICLQMGALLGKLSVLKYSLACI